MCIRDRIKGGIKMATNPMQRKARNSFLLGFMVMLIIAAIIIALLVMQIVNFKQEEQEKQEISVSVKVLNRDVKSGDTITEDVYKRQTLFY